MSINRDERTRADQARCLLTQPAVSLLCLNRALEGFQRGAFFGPTEDINLLISELELSSDDYDLVVISDIPFLGVVMDDTFQLHRNVSCVHHTGFRMGVPTFRVYPISPDDTADLNWSASWVLRVLRVSPYSVVNTVSGDQC